MVYKYLFLLNKKQISTFLYRDGEFEIIKYDGEDFCEYTDEFWNWWEDVTAYDASYSVDFCILVDDSSKEFIDSIKEKIKSYKASDIKSWNKDILENFIKSYLYDIKVILKSGDKENVIQNTVLNNEREYFEVITYPEDNKILGNVKEVVIRDYGDESIVASYYREKTNSLKS